MVDQRIAPGKPARAAFGRTAFTLFELLVVLAIIALLISVLLPSLKAARCQAKKAVCMAHLKNISSTSRVYGFDDPSGWGIPVHHLQFDQDPENPTYIGAYEWGGKSGVGRPGFVDGPSSGDFAYLTSKYGTRAGFGPATRPMNDLLYPGGFTNHLSPEFNREGATADTRLELDMFRCPADVGPPRAGHCPDWLANTERSSYDHFGTSYASNIFMVFPSFMGLPMGSNSPYMRPISRVPMPARTLFYEENIGRWAWAAANDRCASIRGIDIGPRKVIEGWHCRDWTYNRSFVDGHAASQRVLIEGTQYQGYYYHYRKERLGSYPDYAGRRGTYALYRCITIRGEGWAKDTLPAAPIDTGLFHPRGVRASFEDCVEMLQ